MHPAYSVLFFTTLSGAGYGLLVWLSAALLWGGIRAGSWAGIVMLVVGLVLVTAGLLSSTFHLGHPERALKAFSQWRTSWLSREGVAAVVTYVPAVLLGYLWFRLPVDDGGYGIVAVVLAISALVTVWCTGMIYASLPTVRAWAHPLVAPGYIVLALATGGVLFVAIGMLGGGIRSFEILFGLAALLAGWALKTAYWSSIDREDRMLTPGDATGLRKLGKVRVLEPPHAGANFVMREMGYAVARRHAERLRQLVVVCLFLVPIAALLLLFVLPFALGVALVLVAVASAAVGVFTERWLFFAEAQHVVTLYYGAEAA